MNQLREAKPETAAQVLSQLVAPARETGGPAAGEAVALAARQARRLLGSGAAGQRGSGAAGQRGSKQARGAGIQWRIPTPAQFAFSIVLPRCPAAPLLYQLIVYCPPIM
jgi:hypothetical protein